jgi:hypothetical protein
MFPSEELPWEGGSPSEELFEFDTFPVVCDLIDGDLVAALVDSCAHPPFTSAPEEVLETTEMASTAPLLWVVPPPELDKRSSQLDATFETALLEPRLLDDMALLSSPW